MLAGDLEFRSFDGEGNNTAHPDWGAADTPLLRMSTVEYGAGLDGAFPAPSPRVDSQGNSINPRTVSNLVFKQPASIVNDRGLTSFVFQWGQFLDHDLDLTEDFAPVGAAAQPGEDISFPVPTDGSEADLPAGSFIPMLRSRFEWDAEGVAQQVNQITSFMDASNVYGSDAARAGALRAGIGGFLMTSDGAANLADGTGDYLPRNFEVDGQFLVNASPPTTGTGVPLAPGDLFVAGDVRANEQPGLTSMHTLFVREHNFLARRIADELRLDATALSDPAVDERIFQAARALVGAEIQSIAFNEFLPALLGPSQLESYSGYRDDVDAAIANIFSGSLYRVGHTMLPGELLLLNDDGTPVPDAADVLGAAVDEGQVALGEAFFNPALVTTFGIEPYLKGLTEQQVQEIDGQILDAVRNMLFAPPAAIDLGATNVMRGRDHGLPDYNQARVDFGLEPAADFASISSDPVVVAALEAAYDQAGDGVNGYEAVNNIDLFAGAISEDHVPGSSVGELIHTVLVDQFTRLRDGDRFYYGNVFRGRALAELQNTRLSDIIRRNTDLEQIPNEVFRSDSVFTYREDEGGRRADVELRVRDGRLQVIRSRSGRVLASRPLVETQIVTIFGTTRNDRIRIHGSVAAQFTGVVEVHGGGGRGDRLIVAGTPGGDEVSVSPGTVEIGSLSVFHGNLERVDVAAGAGSDRMVVKGAPAVQVALRGGPGPDVIVGGGGNDRLFGGAGPDVLVGRAGADRLWGQAGSDLLIAGDPVADWSQVEAIWTSNLGVRQRIAALQGHVASEDDGQRDFLFGGPGLDWLLSNIDDWEIAGGRIL